MNLFQNTVLIQAVRDAFDLSPPQAQVLLIAYQHGTVSTQTVREVFEFSTQRLSGSHAISHPVRKKLLKQIGKSRSLSNDKASRVYALVDEKTVESVVTEAGNKNIETFRWIVAEEFHSQQQVSGVKNEDQ